ncbi:hypothetical protein Afe04nite_54170 [Asanoa ferruginea]|nr:hypothetical protein Afe04nite_54170 [Asanoa ferruginea]
MFWTVSAGSWNAGIAVSATRAAKTLGMALGQPPGAMALMLATELLTRGRIAAGSGAVAHDG